MENPEYRARKLAANKAWQEANPHKFKKALDTAVKRNVQSRKDRRVAEHGSPGTHCPICLLPFTPSGPRKAVFDHCHQGGHFRGWICCFDNRVLGLMADDPERLRRAAAYLELDRTRNPLPPVLADTSTRRKV